MNECLSYLEKQKIAAPSVLTNTSTGHLPPQQLEFSTPHIKDSSIYHGMTPLTPSTPATPGNSSKISDVESLDSNDTTSVTPEFSKMKLGRGHGRPRKALVEPNMDDFPQDSTEEEKDRYIYKKTMELWHFKKLTSANSVEYRAKENARVKEYQKSRKGKNKSADDSTMSNDEETEWKKKLSRAR